MDSTLKQRLIGAAVLAALAVIFLPMLLKGPDVTEPDAAEVPLTMPATPGQEFETRELPLSEPDGATPPGGVLGMAAAPPVNTSTNEAVPESDATLAEPSAEAASTATAPTTASTAPAAAGAQPAASGSEATPLPAATVGAGSYAVSVGSFSNAETAKALTAKLRAANLPVTSDQIAMVSGNATRLRVGPYADRASAEAARLRTQGVTGGTASVIVLDAIPAATAIPKVAATTPPPKAAPASAAAVTPATSAAKPTAPDSAAAPAKPAVAAAGYAVQLSAPSVEADALALRDRARGAGFSSFVQRIETDTGTRFRVRVGPVADRSAAEALRDAANSKLGTKGIIVTNP
ncbi:MAG: SPOR domain-containing protein [Arenimonas sp.]|nr:SPOR domain-containing protein [Arenimonas sp.]